jgi:hypothetical protein
MKISEVKGRITNAKPLNAGGKIKFSLAVSQKISKANEPLAFETYWIDVITDRFDWDWEKQIAFVRGKGTWSKWKDKEGVERIGLTIWADEINVQLRGGTQVQNNASTPHWQEQNEKIPDWDF